MKKGFRLITCILVILAFVLPLLIKSVFVSANEEQAEGTITMTPSYNTSNGRLSVKGKVVDGSNIKVTIKIISPSDKLVYIGEEMSDGERNFVFTGPITYEEGTYRIYIGSEITKQAAKVSFKIKKKTPVEPYPELDSSPGTGAVTGVGGKGQSLKEQVAKKIEETLKNIDTADTDKAINTVMEIIEQAGNYKDNQKKSFEKDIKLLVEKVLNRAQTIDVDELAKNDEQTEQGVIAEDDGIKRVEIKDEAIADAIKLIDETYEKLKDVLEKKGFSEISATVLSRGKEIRIVTASEKSKALSLDLTVKSFDDLSSKEIAIVIDKGEEEGTVFIIPPKALDFEYITRFLKDAGKEVNSNEKIEELQKRKVSVVIKKVEGKGNQEYIQAANGEEKGGAAFIAASDVFDLYIMLMETDCYGNKSNDAASDITKSINTNDNEDGIYIGKFNKKLTIELPLDGEIVKVIIDKAGNANKVNKEKLGVYRYNPDLKQWDYVGGRVNPDTGGISFRTDSLSTYSVYEYNKTFKDIEKNWAREYIEVLASKHIVHGVNDESFQPGRNVTRAEFTKMLLEALDLVDPDADAAFTDVGKNTWYYKYVATAQKLDIVKGLAGNCFNPEEILTRQDMALMTCRAVEAAGIGLPEVKEYKEFADSEKIANYAKEAVRALQQASILEGTGKNMFFPNNSSARAEAAKIIYMIIQKL